MKILALEFSTSRRSVALLVDGMVRGYAEADAGSPAPPLALVDATLKAAGLERLEMDRVAAGLGPGSYTGVRMALSIAQGFAMAAGLEGVGISSMHAMASAVPGTASSGRFHVIVDAQRGDFYVGDFEAFNGRAVETRPLRIVNEAEIRRLLKQGALVLGPDLAGVLPEVRVLHPDARVVARLAGEAATGSNLELLKPIYLRPAAFKKAPAH